MQRRREVLADLGDAPPPRSTSARGSRPPSRAKASSSSMSDSIRWAPLTARGHQPAQLGGVEARRAPRAARRPAAGTSSTAVSGLCRSWLTWPANAASCSLDRCSSARARSSCDTVAPSSRVRSSSSSRSTTRSGQGGDRPLLVVGRAARGTVSNTHSVPMTIPFGRQQLVGGVEADVADRAGHERVVPEPFVQARVGYDDRAPVGARRCTSSPRAGRPRRRSRRRRPGAARCR